MAQSLRAFGIASTAPFIDLSLIDKSNYLRALLDGPAATIIQGLSLSEANLGLGLSCGAHPGMV